VLMVQVQTLGERIVRFVLIIWCIVVKYLLKILGIGIRFIIILSLSSCYLNFMLNCRVLSLFVLRKIAVRDLTRCVRVRFVL
jgi:hypothetical protein